MDFVQQKYSLNEFYKECHYEDIKVSEDDDDDDDDKSKEMKQPWKLRKD